MTRIRDYIIAFGLLLPPLLSLVGGVFFFPLALIGVPGLLFVAPISYKLFRYPSTHKNSLGEIAAATRQTGNAGPFGTGGALVCFSGIDGSGKTTEAKSVVSELQENGVDATHVWARWRPFVSYPFMGVLYVMLGWRRKDYHKSKLIQRLWGYFLLVDHIVFFFRYIYPSLRKGEVVVIDRYILDQLVEMEYDGLYWDRSAALIESWLPTPDATFLMDVPAEVAEERKQDTEEMLDRLRIDEEPIEYLRTRRELFHRFASEDVTVIDTTRPIEQTHEKITDEIWQAYIEF
ncbi:dTMP kinase [Halapricum desulfuricans]|nr:hypothetical protein [Halapricum desulfuricans]